MLHEKEGKEELPVGLWKGETLVILCATVAPEEKLKYERKGKSGWSDFSFLHLCCMLRFGRSSFGNWVQFLSFEEMRPSDYPCTKISIESHWGLSLALSSFKYFHLSFP